MFFGLYIWKLLLIFLTCFHVSNIFKILKNDAAFDELGIYSFFKIQLCAIHV